MRKSALVLVVCAVLFAAPIWANTLSVVVGNGTAGTDLGTFANGTFASNGQIPGTAPFGHSPACGTETNTGSNCDATWTFNYAASVGLVANVTSAKITFGLLGLDSAQPGTQEALFALTTGAGENFTTAWQQVAEPVADGGLGTNVSGRASCPNASDPTKTVLNCPEYNIYSFTITDLADLAGGTASFHLTLSGPGFNTLSTAPNHAVTFNGATLDFAELDITGTPKVTPPIVPEPSSLLLLGTGMSGIAAMIRRKLRRQ